MIGLYTQYKSIEISGTVDSKARYLAAVERALVNRDYLVWFDGAEKFGVTPNTDDPQASIAFPTTGSATLPDGSTTLRVLKILSCAADTNDKAQSLGQALWALTEIEYL